VLYKLMTMYIKKELEFKEWKLDILYIFVSLDSSDVNVLYKGFS